MAKTTKNNQGSKTKPDTLSAEELAADYGYALAVINADPEIKALFDRAVKEQWTSARFKAGLQNSNWYRNNSEYAREAFVKRAMGGADWEEIQRNARLAVEQEATASGSPLSEEAKQALAIRYINEGWDRDGRGGFLKKALADYIATDTMGPNRGQAGNIADELKQLAYNNGIRYSSDFYISAAKSVNSGLTTREDWERDIRSKAASLFPVFKDQINAGMSARELASPYMELMAQTFEIPSTEISLDDPYIRNALGGFDDKGQPTAMNLWDFSKKLRNDPRWMNTLQANNEIASVADSVMQMFGLRG